MAIVSIFIPALDPGGCLPASISMFDSGAKADIAEPESVSQQALQNRLFEHCHYSPDCQCEQGGVMAGHVQS
jgi:hypothetical protein